MTGPLIPFSGPLKTARFIRREKRFTVLAEDPDNGRVIKAHTNNTGSMLGLLGPGCELLLSPAANPARKLRWTLECVRHQGFLVGVNTLTPNRISARAYETGSMPEIADATAMRREVKVGESRLDALFSMPEGRLWMEAKNVTMSEYGQALFPDAATDRGRRHLRELTRLVEKGDRAALFFCIQRPDAECFAPADFIDPEYADLFHRALEKGVEAWPYMVEIEESGISLGRRLSVSIP